METGPNVQSGVRVYIRVGKMKKVLSPEARTKLVEFLGRLNAIPDVKIPDGFLDDDKDRFPSFPITTLMNEESMSRFLDALEFIAGEIESEGN